ncbi:MAG: hypothetical protein K8S00_12815 [Bacteroidales bacterium]|nr:hypothetical protein [Bacteroidales bacterium]
MKKFRAYYLIIYCILLFSVTHSQNNTLRNTIIKKNIIDISLGGSGLFLSANYSRVIFITSKYFVNTSVGIGTVPFVGGFSVPHQISFNIGKENSFLELGIGGSYWSGKSNSSGYTETLYSYNLSPIIGWRKNFKSNMSFRAYLNPLIHISGEYYIENYSVVPYLGVSIGYAF